MGAEKILHASKNSNPPSRQCSKRKLDKLVTDGMKDTAFMELFAGEAGLTLAVKREVGNVFTPGDIEQNSQAGVTMDLLNNETFKTLKSKIKKGLVRWLHLAPPCKTFSRARRRDRLARVRKLRSVQHPEGFKPYPKLVAEANKLASRSAQLCLLQWKAGGVFSLENPASSLIWLYKPVARLKNIPKVTLKIGDQCCYGCEYRKPTGWLTNADHLEILTKQCPGEPLHLHPPLAGLTQDFHGEWVWKTSLAAEYPQGLCEEVAKSFCRWLEANPQRANSNKNPMKDGEVAEDWTSARYRREKENQECIGGLRNPRFAIDKLPGWPKVGAILFKTMVDICRLHPRVYNMVNDLGSPPSHDWATEVSEFRSLLSERLDIKGPVDSEGVWGEALSRLVELSGDPDGEAASWPTLGAPLGIVHRIPAGGVFPMVTEDKQKSEEERLNHLLDLGGATNNYKSYEENKTDADALFEQEVDKGFAEWSTSRGELESKVGPLVTSSIGVIVKYKGQPPVKKVRLVHDLRRSQVNNGINLEERLVLPRMRDAASDALDLMEERQPGEFIALLSLDFSDAFKQIPVKHEEKRFLSGQAMGGYFYFHKVLFGIKTGPLVWCRLAALISRCTQSCFHPNRLRMQLFVDDPLITLRGSEDQIQDMTVKVLLLWLALGLKVAWQKGSLNVKTEWIGAGISVDNVNQRLVVKVTQDKVEEWKSLANNLSFKPTVSSKELQRFVGKMNWAAGFVQQIKPFVRMLYAALYTDKGLRTNPGGIYGKQIEPAMKWLNLYLNDIKHGLTWIQTAHLRHCCCLDFVVDASPWGGGAIRYVGAKYAERVAIVWNSEDEEKTGARIGDPASQALWEAYMMLRCLWCWMKADTSGGFVRIRGDAQGVLAAFVKRSAKSPLLNNIVKEVSLHLARHLCSLEALHLWSEQNEHADLLSRLADPKGPGKLPEELASLPEVRVVPVLWHE